MNAITFILPLPPPELSPNARGHYRKKAPKTKAARNLAYGLALETSLTKDRTQFPFRKARMVIHWYCKTARLIDNDNAIASLKAYRDGIADAGILINDNHIKELSIDVNKDASNPRVEITLIELP